MSAGVSARDLVMKAATKEHAAADHAPRSDEAPDLSLDLAEHQLFYTLERLKQQLKESQETHTLRLNYAGRVFWLVCAWLICVAIAVFLSGLKLFGFELSDPVLIAFITSTTVNVVGLFVVVAKWMFPHHGADGSRGRSGARGQSAR